MLRSQYSSTCSGGALDSSPDVMRKQLSVMRELTAVMQSSDDPSEVRETLVRLLVIELGYEAAVMGIIDQDAAHISGWLAMQAAGEPLPLLHTSTVKLDARDGAIARQTLRREVAIVRGCELSVSLGPLSAHLAQHSCVVVPMQMRSRDLGVLVVVATDGTVMTGANLDLIQDVADHACLAMGSVQLCVERTQRLTREQERNRIAREIHDTVAQSLFGLVCGLDGCAQQLSPGSPLRASLCELHDAGVNALMDVRRSVFDLWETEFTDERFIADLRRTAGLLNPRNDVQFDVIVHGSLQSLPEPQRLALRRVAQEALTNVIKHAGARHACVSLDVSASGAMLVVEDDGHRLPPSQSEASGGYGLYAMRQRMREVGGSLDVVAMAEGGASVIAIVGVPACPLFENMDCTPRHSGEGETA